MAGKKIVDIVRYELKDLLKENGYELYHVEFVKEGPDWFLRVYIDRDASYADGKDGSDSGYIGTGDCEIVSRFLSRRLDEIDPVDHNYFLEVSSPGLDRKLVTQEHYKKYTGHEIEVSLYQAVDGSRKHTGILESTGNDTVIIRKKDGNTVELKKEKIAGAKLTVNI